MKSINYFIVSILLIFFFANCKKTDNASTITTKTAKGINGYVQKGPFINGSSITLYDLNADLSPTGKSYNTRTTDNKGAFSFDNITLSSNFASFQANGFYFNEVSGALSAAPINLYAISQVSDSTNVNINLLTYLEKARVETLIKNGKSFSDAKQQAQKEVLAIFGIIKPDIKPSENLNIAETGDDNAILLAISSILQSNLSEAQLSELLSNISNDIKDDGVVNSVTLSTELLNNAIYLDTASIKTNLINKYGQLGQTFSDLDFGKYIDSFIIKSSLKSTGSEIYYLPFQSWNVNFLDINDTTFTANENVVYGYGDALGYLDAYIPKGDQLTVKITELGVDPTKAINTFGYYSTGPPIYGFIQPDYTSGDYSLTIKFDPLYYYMGNFYSIEARLSLGYSYLIEYYENGSTTPTRTKTIHII